MVAISILNIYAPKMGTSFTDAQVVEAVTVAYSPKHPITPLPKPPFP